MSKRDTRLLLEDIVECAEKIQRYTDGMTLEDFSSNGLVVDAVVRNFEIIGEAANRLPDDVKDAMPTVDWFRIRGFRNRIVHDYVNISFKTVWDIRNNYLPSVVAEIKRLLERMP